MPKNYTPTEKDLLELGFENVYEEIPFFEKVVESENGNVILYYSKIENVINFSKDNEKGIDFKFNSKRDIEFLIELLYI